MKMAVMNCKLSFLVIIQQKLKFCLIRRYIKIIINVYTMVNRFGSMASMRCIIYIFYYEQQITDIQIATIESNFL